MKKVNRKSAIVESVYMTDDGKEYPYRCQALEHERNVIQNKLNTLERKEVAFDEIGVNLVLYQITTHEDIQLMLEFYDINKMRIPELEGSNYAGFYTYRGKEYSICQTEIINLIKEKFDGLI